MINRIRDIRKQLGLTLAEVAARCDPPTTTQTIGRLETGMRTLSLDWLNRIAAALDVEAEHLLGTGPENTAALVARLTETGAEALPAARMAITPTALVSHGPWRVLEVEAACGEYRKGDQIWLREAEENAYPRLVNRDTLAPRRGGRFAFGRLIDRDARRIVLLPPGTGQKQIVVDQPQWIAVAEILVRRL